SSKASPPTPPPYKPVESANEPKYSVMPEARASDTTSDRFRVLEFTKNFLQVCIEGDYSGYRKLVSRTTAPYAKDRFEKAYNAVKLVTIERIEALTNPRLPERTHLVEIKIEFQPGQKAALRR